MFSVDNLWLLSTARFPFSGAMDAFGRSCEGYRDYPKNLTQHSALSHSTERYFDRLVDQSKYLFQSRKIAVDFLDYLEDQGK